MFDNSVHRNIAHQAKITSRTNGGTLSSPGWKYYHVSLILES